MFPSDDGRGRIPPFSPPSLSLCPASEEKGKRGRKGLNCLPPASLPSNIRRVRDWPTGRETWLFCAAESFDDATFFGMLFSVLWRIPHHLPPSWARSLGSPLLGRGGGGEKKRREQHAISNTGEGRKKKALGKKIYLSTVRVVAGPKVWGSEQCRNFPDGQNIFHFLFFLSQRLKNETRPCHARRLGNYESIVP